MRGREAPAIGAEGYCTDAAGARGEDVDDAARLGGQHLCGAVSDRQGEVHPVGAEGDAADRIGVAAQQEERFTALGRDELRGAVSAQRELQQRQRTPTFQGLLPAPLAGRRIDGQARALRGSGDGVEQLRGRRRRDL